MVPAYLIGSNEVDFEDASLQIGTLSFTVSYIVVSAMTVSEKMETTVTNVKIEEMILCKTFFIFFFPFV